MEETENKRFRILSIDGGGIRGLIPAKVLTVLEAELQREAPGKKLHEYFNLICGTSTGAILAIGIALGIPAAELARFYRENARMIFPKWYLKIIPQRSRAIITSIYSNRKLRKKLEEVYAAANNGETPLLDDLKSWVCIPAFNGNDGMINVFKTRHLEEYFRDYKLPAHEVALSSASAPVYFPPHTFSFSNKYGSGTNVNMIDGGIFANNPSLIGLLEATEKLEHEISTVSLLSLGTGQGRHIIKSGWKPKDIWYWLLPKPRLLDVILDSQTQITEQYVGFLRRAFEKKGSSFEYLRVQHDLGSDTIDLNASSRKDLMRLDAIGDELAKKHINSILQHLKK